jgi:hypothetical protein
MKIAGKLETLSGRLCFVSAWLVAWMMESVSRVGELVDEDDEDDEDDDD